MDDIKLIKNIHRFSHSKRPRIGDIVSFMPLTNLIPKHKIRTDFIFSYITKMAKCVVVSHTKYLTNVNFIDNKNDTVDMVSPDLLAKITLTKAAERAMAFLLSKTDN